MNLTTIAGKRAACGYSISQMTCAACAHARRADGWCLANEFHVNLDRGFCRDFDYIMRTPQRPSLPGGTRSVASVCAKTIFDGSAAIPAAHINGYLCDAPDAFIENRSKPICDVPPMNFGNMPRDGGNLIIEAEDYEQFLAEEPQAAPLIRPLLGAEEFLHNQKRYCLWLVGANPALLQKCPKVRERIEASRQMRLSSKAAANTFQSAFSRRRPLSPTCYRSSPTRRSTTSACSPRGCTMPGCGRWQGGLKCATAIPRTSSTTTSSGHISATQVNG